MTVCSGQTVNVIGTYTNEIEIPKLAITFNSDSTFTYTSTEHPTFYRWEDFAEKGKWTILGDTIILNSQLSKKPYVESELQEHEIKNDTGLFLTFNHIKRYFDDKGDIIKTDTLQVNRLDYGFNKFEKKKLTRVAQHSTVKCAYTGYIPHEILTSNRTIAISKPPGKLESIFIGCYELQGIREFNVKNPNSSHLTLNIFSNYYQDGQIRQKKLLIKNEDVLYSRQMANGKFDKGGWTLGTILKKKKSGS